MRDGLRFLGLGVVAALCWVAGSASAGCATSAPGTLSCTGNLADGIAFENQGGLSTVDVYGLTAPIAPQGFFVAGIRFGYQSAAGRPSEVGQTAPNLTLGFAGKPFGIASLTGDGISMSTQGGAGGAGSADHPWFGGSKQGHPGGAGGGGGGVTIQFRDGSVTSIGPEAEAVWVSTQGGAGGAGGLMDPKLVGNAHGGVAGAGGAGGVIAINVVEGSFTQRLGGFGSLTASSAGGTGGVGGEGKGGGGGAGYGGAGGVGGAAGSVNFNLGSVTITETGGTGAAVLGFSTGGHGGTGGVGESTVADANGGAGGTGGAGGAVTISSGISAYPGTLTIATTQDTQHGVQGVSRGGTGGTGGSGSAGFPDAFPGTGGHGGVGGAGGNVVVQLTGAKISTGGDDALGVFARSYGGAGGDGGVGSGSRGRGGADLGGGPGGSVSVSYAGTLETQGRDSNGVFAHSVGGFSGDAGNAEGFIAYGASGQSAGDGGAVDVVLAQASSVRTQGDSAVGVTAQSVGGGGGKGSTASGIVALGGDGSAGGSGGTVRLGNVGRVTTAGNGSDALFAGSHGGGGGDGGGAHGVVAVGGRAGSGGNGGNVTVANGTAGVMGTGMLSTTGDQSDGIFAGSHGGGGGKAHSTAGLVSIGGAGGGGGAGGVVLVQNNGVISTTGQDADGVLVQSIGGGGGAGSNALAVSAFFSMAIGGRGGAGGDGGSAKYADGNLGGYEITTTGERARGIFVHSVGGGGGDAGNAISASASPVFDFAIGAGGDGGPGGNGGIAQANASAGMISTRGGNAAAIYVESTGGGGGHAGTTVTVAEGASFSSTIAVGGSGGAGGNGGLASAAANGLLQTTGNTSPGMFVHSVGGGGGYAGTTVAGSGVSMVAQQVTLGGSGGNGGTGAAVGAASSGAIQTAGHASPGIEASSVGGGGGAAHFVGTFTTASNVSLGVTIGGRGGGGGDADTVTVAAAGSIGTAGHNAPGITASSIGGGGGHGSTTITGSALSGGTIGVTVGGSGGVAGDGGDVAVTNQAVITTQGHNSDGIQALSTSHGGGNSGVVATASAVSVGAIGTTVGGSGGSGGTSGAVTVNNQGNVTTAGVYASAIDAQSIAGGGGSARGAITTSGVSMGNLSVTVGGGGGSSGAAGPVTVTSTGNLQTQGPMAHGIVAQSQGGSGGHGGFAVESGFNVGEVTGSVNVSLGGNGGTGGTGGAVVVNTSGSIRTGDINSYGISAQSIGGDGGIGGAVYSGNASASASGSVKLTGNYGGNGGSGNVGGSVKVNNGADITTASFLSTGINAQSIGGSGGVGANVYTVTGGVSPASSFNFTASLGGAGGNGDRAGTVDVVNAGRIVTEEGGSPGIDAGSTGGGGGRGGNAGSINVDLTGGGAGKTLTGKIAIAAGGNGGKGGDGDAVNVQNRGTVTTEGIASYGIHALSVGGGGGAGGTASSFTYGFNGICKLVTQAASTYICKVSQDAEGETKVNFSLQVDVGGRGEAGGNGGTVTVATTADVTTDGALSHAIYAKSVGGGGGHGGQGASGIQAWTSNAIANNLVSYGKTFTSLPSFTSINVAVGGAGGAAGTGGAVSVTNGATLATSGAYAFGIHAQSVGGGGGDGGAGSEGLWGKLGVGGLGSGGGDGGTVTVTSPGAIKTAGAGSIGIFAHSVGGGGGTAGDVHKGFSQSWIGLNIGVGVGIQLHAGVGGNGGNVTVAAGPITTTGEGAHGIVVQSVGGSGGVAGISGAGGAEPLGYAGSAGDPGKGGAVTVTVGGVVNVSGDSSHGIFAQSASGKGAGDTGGAVTIGVNADVLATGASGRAILAQSQGQAGNGTVAITVAKGATVATGAAGAETIGIKDGSNNTITNAGTITQGNAASYVIRADGTGSTTRVVNTGTITGSMLGTVEAAGTATAATAATAAPVPSGAGSAVAAASGISLENRSGGTINAGTLLDIARFDNQGVLSVGGSGRTGSTHLTGSLVQGAGGVLAVDLDPRGAAGAGVADRLVIDGRADLGGRIAINLLDPWQPVAGPHSVPLVSAGTGVSLSAIQVPRSAVAQYRLDLPATGAVNLAYDIDFANTGIVAQTNDNQDGIARHLHAVYRAQALDGDTTRHLLAVEDAGSFAAIVNSYSAELAVDNQMVSLLTAIGFNDTLLGCAERNGDYRYLDQGRCGWIAARGQRFTQSATGDNLGFGDTSWQIAAGGQVDVGDQWFVGGGLGYVHHSLGVDSGTMRSTGDQVQAGALVTRRWGAAEFAGMVDFGYTRFDNRRTLWDGTNVSATQKQWLASGQLRAAYLVPVGDWALKPRVDLGLQYLAMDGYSESGASGFRLQVDDQNASYGYVQPAVDLVTEWTTGDGTLIRPRLTLGITQFLGGAKPSVSGRFAMAPGDTERFTTSTALDATRLDLGATVDVFARKDFSLRAEAFGSFSDNTRSYGGGVKATLGF